MVNVEFIGQLVDSMDNAVSRLEQATVDKNMDEMNKLRVFIFELHKKIAGEVGTVNGKSSEEKCLK